MQAWYIEGDVDTSNLQMIDLFDRGCECYTRHVSELSGGMQLLFASRGMITTFMNLLCTNSACVSRSPLHSSLLQVTGHISILVIRALPI